MSAPPNQLAQLLGNLLPKVQGDPTLSQYGKGVGLTFDLAANAPDQFWTPMPVSMDELGDDPAHGVHEADFRR